MLSQWTADSMGLFSLSNRSTSSSMASHCLVNLNINTTLRKQAVTSQSQELEALEAKLKETEERLKQRQSSPAAKAVGGSNSSNSPHRRKPIGDAFSGQENDRLQPSTSSPLGTQPPASSSVSPSTMSHWYVSCGGFSPHSPTGGVASQVSQAERASYLLKCP